MLRAFVFNRTSVLVRHWFEIDLGDSSMEHGALPHRGPRTCRVDARTAAGGTPTELRLLDVTPHRGTESAAQRFVIDRPVWRADLFDRVTGTPGAFEVAHHHPVFDGLEPSARSYLDEEPWQWLRSRLGDIGETAAAAGVPRAEVAEDAADVRDHAAEIVTAAQGVAPARCTSNEQCHRWTRDVAESVRLMIATTRSPHRLDRAHVAPWAASVAEALS